MSERVDDIVKIAKDTVQLTPFHCEWQHKDGKCSVLLASWNAYKEHLFRFHGKPHSNVSWRDCKLPKCNAPAHNCLSKLTEHFEIAHLSNVLVVCPLAKCAFQKPLKFSGIAKHLTEFHPQLPTIVSPSDFRPTLRPFAPSCLTKPKPLPTRPLIGLVSVNVGSPRKPSSPQSQRVLAIPPSQTQTRQIPTHSRHVASMHAKRQRDTADECDIMDLEMDNLVHAKKPRPGETVEVDFSMLLIGKRDEGMKVDLAGPGPMVDPRVLAHRPVERFLYFPNFARRVEQASEEAERKMQEEEAEAERKKKKAEEEEEAKRTMEKKRLEAEAKAEREREERAARIAERAIRRELDALRLQQEKAQQEADEFARQQQIVASRSESPHRPERLMLVIPPLPTRNLSF